ncbi:hypothetical protein Clacol_001949 [Clathrus columnatus]|uniref:Response regulatory domain-containing protein n=1 Tax=Clathrus columnatus TaxID=1419009 RepID=A0AAV5A399_9AGAM|nr:hypothetical protein Clacol_001949 [Clathrus columnatus]
MSLQSSSQKSSTSSRATPTPVPRPTDLFVQDDLQPRPQRNNSKNSNKEGFEGDGNHDLSPTTNVTSPTEADTALDSPTLPRLSRAFSTPLPQQITHWQRPRRLPSNLSEPPAQAAADQHFQDLALELADSVQQAVQTLLHLSPPHIFDPAKEQFSPCTVQIPTTSLSALLTSMKNLNYISANIQTLNLPTVIDTDPSDLEDIVKDEFDIGEVLQSVGDSFSGLSSEAEVDVILHHGDAIQHVGVKGDECGISYALTHVIHQILATAQPGDSLEIGLSISGPQNIEPDPFLAPLAVPEDSPTAVEFITCTFDISHQFFPPQTLLSDNMPLSPQGSSEPLTEPSIENEELSLPLPSSNIQTRAEPSFDSIILRRLLSRIGGALRTSWIDVPDSAPPNSRRCGLVLNLERGPALSVLHQRGSPVEEDADHDITSDIPLAREPSLDELMVFAESLRGKEVAFHANSRSTFAHHLTRYLASWGVVIAHIPTDGAEEQDFLDDSFDEGIPTVIPSTSSQSLKVNDNGSISISKTENSISMIIIDDDVHALRRRLLKHRAEVMPGRKRPSLAANHRPRSSPSIRNVLLAAGVQQFQSPPAPFIPVPIIHFTSLTRYKLVKDVIQGVIFTPVSAQFLPEVIVIPKPAGPRRILAALHTAMTKPMVDPFFSPIATSPMSPGAVSPMSLNSNSSRKQTTAPLNSRNGSERTIRSNSESLTVSSSSPLSSTQETFEYFPEEAVQLGDSPASGLVIHSPDGRPGILFQPPSRSNSSRNENDHESLRPPVRHMTKSYSRKEGRGLAALPINISRAASNESNKLRLEQRASRYPDRLSPLSPYIMGDPPLSPTEYGRVVKPKTVLDPSMVEQLQDVASMSWEEATRHLAMTAMSSHGSHQIEQVTSLTQSDEPSTSHIDTVNTAVRTTSSGSEAKLTAKRSPTLSAAPKGKKSKTTTNGIVPPINVLIVEDNPINQTHYTTVLRRNSIKYEVAWNGREAVDKWRKGNFHLILMDIQMPIMDGISATKEIRRLERAEQIGEFSPAVSESSRKSLGSFDSRSSITDTSSPSQVIIVALTASSLQSDRVAALAAGCNDFLTKPVDNDWLIDKVIEWGSIKALQMWAELPPQLVSTIDRDQAVQAQSVAERLYVPSKATRTNSPEKQIEELPDVEERSPLERKNSASNLQSSDDLREGDEHLDVISESTSTAKLPQGRPRTELTPVTGETALLRYIEDSQIHTPTEGLIAPTQSTMSITSVLYDTTKTGDLTENEPSDDSNQSLLDNNLNNP